MTIFVTFAGRWLRASDIFCLPRRLLSTSVWRIPNAAGESNSAQGSSGDRTRTARKRGRRSGSRGRVNTFTCTNIILDYQLGGVYHRNEIRLPGSAHLRTFGYAKMGESPWIQYKHAILQTGVIWKIFVYIFLWNLYLGNIFHSVDSPTIRCRRYITGNNKKSNRIRCIDLVENDFLNAARNLMGIVCRSCGARGEKDTFRKRR